jgi:threonine dehydrogenase-like Zn-dependent dehydrogenase
MCGSDIPFFCGRKPNLPYPLRSGFPIHECVGQVIQSTADGYKSGDWVLAIPEESRGLAEYFIARADKAVHLPGKLGDRSNCCLIQPLATVMNGVDRLGDISGASVAVVGLGSIGLLFCWLLKKRGAGRIIGIDPLSTRCQTAERLGADLTYPAHSQEYIAIAADNQLNPVEICIEAVGHQMQTINDCFEIIQQRGTVLAFGVPDQEIYSLDYETFFRKNAHLLAVVTPDWQEYLGQARELYSEYREELATLVTHSFSINDAEEAFNMYTDHEDGILKAVIDLSPWENNNGHKYNSHE